MQKSAIHIGAVIELQLDKRLIRIIAFDENEVLYEAWRDETPEWRINNLKRTIYYMRLPVSIILDDGVYVKTENYTTEETAIHRPDLPFRLAQSTFLEWSANAPPAFEQFSKGLLHSKTTSPVLSTTLDAPALYLSPFGPKGSVKPGVLVKSLNGVNFTAAELLWHASILQAENMRDIRLVTGVGIYRGGIQRKLPSYYIWGARSRSE